MCALIGLFLFAHTGMGRIIVGPKDTEAVVGTQLVLHCQTDIKDSTNPVEWHFRANAYDAYVTLYKDMLILNGNKGKMKVDANAAMGRYDLVIFSVSINNAGAYICLDDNSQQKAEIIVFEQYPSDKSCSLSKPSDIILGMNQCNMEPDHIEISCRLQNRGNLKPRLEWFSGEQLISSNSSTTGGITTSTVLLRADTLHFPTFNCRVAYENNMTSMFNWTTTVSVTSTSNLTTVTKTGCSQTKTNCSALANFKCSSVWIDDSNKVVVNGSLLGLEDLPDGNYTCIATCSIRESPCSLVREQIVYTCDAKQKNMEDVIPISLVVSIVIVHVMIVLLLVSIVTLRLIRRKQGEKGIHSAIGGPKIHTRESSSNEDGDHEVSVPVAVPVSTEWETNDLQEQQKLVDV